MKEAFSVQSRNSTAIVERLREPDGFVSVLTVVEGKGAKTIRLRPYDALRLADALKESVEP